MIKLNDKEITIDELENLIDDINEDMVLVIDDEVIYEKDYPKIGMFIFKVRAWQINCNRKSVIKDSQLHLTQETVDKHCTKQDDGNYSINGLSFPIFFNKEFLARELKTKI